MFGDSQNFFSSKFLKIFRFSKYRGDNGTSKMMVQVQLFFPSFISIPGVSTSRIVEVSRCLGNLRIFFQIYVDFTIFHLLLMFVHPG